MLNGGLEPLGHRFFHSAAVGISHCVIMAEYYIFHNHIFYINNEKAVYLA